MMEALKAEIVCVACHKPMYVASIIPCPMQHRVCEACAIQYGSKCPMCLKRYRRPRKPCKLTNAVAAVVFKDKEYVGNLTPKQHSAYQKQLLVESCATYAHCTRDASAYIAALKKHVATEPSVTRCWCSPPGLEGGFVMIPRSKGEKQYIGCPCWPKNDCGFFRWIKQKD